MTTQNLAIAFDATVEPLNTGVHTLTANAFELLLKHLDDDREEAARKYVSFHTRLTRYFDWRGYSMSDCLADETMTRIARKIERGVAIVNFQAFMFGVARKVAIEASKAREREHKLVTSLSYGEPSRDRLDEEILASVDAALLKLTPSGRELLLAYYGTGDDKNMELRRKLAEREGVSLNALRIRVYRLKSMLEMHVKPSLNIDSRSLPTGIRQALITSELSGPTLRLV